MITGIAGGQGIAVTSGNLSAPYIDSSRPSAGMMRYIGSNIEVYDGSGWIILSNSYPTIQLTPDVHELLQWAKQKRDEEYRIKELIREHPTLAAALEIVKDAQSKFDMLAVLVQDPK